jgi:hypothetical protein
MKNGEVASREANGSRSEVLTTSVIYLGVETNGMTNWQSLVNFLQVMQLLGFN